MRKVKILLIEDDEITSEYLKAILEKLGYEVVGTAETSDEAFSIALNNSIDLVLSDIQIRGLKDGIDVASVFQKTYNLPIIFMTAFNDDIKIQRASALDNMVGYLVKPIRVVELHTMIKIAISKFKILEKTKIKNINKYYKYNFDEKILYDNKKNEKIQLTKNESLLLSLLLNGQNEITSFSNIKESIWSNGKGNDLARRQLIHRLKMKVPHFEIFSVKGIGIGIKE